MQCHSALSPGAVAQLRDVGELKRCKREKAVLTTASIARRLSAASTSLLLALPVLSVMAQGQDQKQEAAHRSAASSISTSAQGARVHRLPASVSLKLDKNLPCSTSKTLKVLAVAPSSADKSDHLATGELMLIQAAATTRRPLVVTNPSCDNEGAIVGTALSLEPVPSKPADLCALPYAKERAPECR
jgi:hypothetical protein